MAYQWKVAAKASGTKAIINQLLINRGFKTKPAIKEFFNPSLPKKADFPLAKAVARIKQAVKLHELIYIYGDYDADGITATAILWEALHSLDARVMPYIPSRNEPIRGLSPLGIDNIIKLSSKLYHLKPDLIITVDNGISAFKGCEYAKKLGIDVIISDHHVPRDTKLPPAVAIVHTTNLAGAGVAWFLAREVLRHLRGEKIPHLGGELLDLAGIGTIADMVPLLNTNRALAKFGLEALRQTTRPGLKVLAKLAELDLTTLQAWQVGYSLAPRLNAMGRMEQALDALRLICTQSPDKAKDLAVNIQATNQLRQDKTSQMFQDAKDKFLAADQTVKLIFVSSKDYHEGVVGLVAGRLAEEFNRPAFVVAIGQHYAKASCRTPKGFNAIESIRSLSHLLMEHGGHELAAGFTCAVDKLPEIKLKLEKLAAADLTADSTTPALNIDCQLEIKDINWELFNELEKFQPFGFGNPQPVFSLNQVKLKSCYPVGQEKKHLKLTLQGETLKVEAIAFNFGHLADQLKPGQPIDIAFTLDANSWNSHQSLQLKIKDIIA